MSKVNLDFLSSAGIDQIFQVITGSMPISNARNFAVDNPNINYEQVDANKSGEVFPHVLGVFTIDNDPTVYNMSGLNGSALTNSYNIGCECYIVSKITQTPFVQLLCFVASGRTIPDSLVHTVNYTVVVYASDNNTGTIIPDVQNDLHLNFNTKYNYQNIALSGSTPFTLSNTTTNRFTINHNLGYKPFVRAAFHYPLVAPISYETDDALSAFYTDNIVTDTQVIIQAPSDVWAKYGWAPTQDGTLYYRIYY